MERVQILEKFGEFNNPRNLSNSELYMGSKSFSKDEILGSGGFGRIYRAVLSSYGSVVAVKYLAERSDRFEKTFAAELLAMAHLRHQNFVILRGSVVLDWGQRVKIVNGLAAALFYLQEQLETQVIHKDVKTSNVMLDYELDVRLGDFGFLIVISLSSISNIGIPDSQRNSIKVLVDAVIFQEHNAFAPGILARNSDREVIFARTVRHWGMVGNWHALSLARAWYSSLFLFRSVVFGRVDVPEKVVNCIMNDSL
ncbi:hypothetical protein ACET3Z_001751 [Daucus carota]